MMRASTAALVAVLLVSSAVLSAQNSAKALTNDDVVKMAAAGLPESTIVQVIQRGPTAFDTSPKLDLESGEYIMVLGGINVRSNSSAGFEGTTGYDFGIQRVQ